MRNQIAPFVISPAKLFLIILAITVSASVIAYAWIASRPAQEADITVASDPVGGALVRIDGAGVTTPTIFSWAVGSQHVFEAVSNVGDQNVRIKWTGWSDHGNQTHIFVVPTTSTTVKASFQKQYYLNVTSSQGTPSTRGGWFDAGTSLTASVNNSTRLSDDLEFICSGWVGTGSVSPSGNNTSVAFTLNKPSSLTWIWMARYRVNFAADPFSCGTISPSGTGFYFSSLQSISAVPKNGYKFSSWNAVGGLSITESLSASTTVRVSGSGTVTAEFVPATMSVIISSNPSGSEFVKVDGALQVTPYSVTWQVGSVHNLEAIAQATGPLDSRYVWVNWSDGKSLSHDFTVPDMEQTITANYKSQYRVTFSVNPSRTGVISPSGTNWYDSDSLLSMSAVGNSGYVLSSWNTSGSLITLSNQSSTSALVRIKGSGNLTANFAMSNVTVTLRSAPAGAGFIKVDGVLQSTPYSLSWVGGSVHTLEALSPVPAGLGVQYVWKSWSDGGTQNDTYRVPSTNSVIEATFEIQYCLVVQTKGVPSTSGYVAGIKLNGVQQGTANDETPFIQWIVEGYSLGTLGVDGKIFAGVGTQEVFVKWVEDESTFNPRNMAMMISPLNFTAMYQTQCQVVFNVNPANLGTTTPSGSNNWYAIGTSFTNQCDYQFPQQFLLLDCI